MHWAKTRGPAPFNLASSGVAPFPFKELPFDLDTLEIQGDNGYGYGPLRMTIARHAGVEEECVVEAAGTSMANHLVMATLLEPDDEVLVEHPVYPLIPDVLRYLRADIKYFARREENGWAVEVDEIRRHLSSRTKLIVLTNLHNPTSVLTPDPVLREVGLAAAKVGAHVLVDEVYLEAVYEEKPRSAFHLGENLVTTSSLTKNFGLSGLRCGWVLAKPALASRIQRLNDLFGSTPVHAGERISVAAFAHLSVLRAKARAAVEIDRKLLRDFLAARPELAHVETRWGLTAFPRLRSGETDHFVDRLREEFETSVVPGNFFGCPDHFRIGLGADHTMFAEGLARMTRALAG